ncbi:hypothetical protein F4809DRAFT_657566 [Biscogniauxia mediterranea]|nr:hypothetical protein F4809DRAFT_657566 [Biscogniauxia mediterranea]
MDTEIEDEALRPRTHPLKIFDAAKAQRRFVYACAPMVRYSKLAFRQTVRHYGADLCWTPMILAKEFNRSAVARDSDLTISSPRSLLSSSSSALPPPPPSSRAAVLCEYDGELPTIAQFGASDAAELARAASLAAPFVNGVDLNCGCPQSWACAASLGAALMERREVVREMVVRARRALADDGWGVGLERDMDGGDRGRGRGRSVSVKIRVHKDLRRTVDFVNAVLWGEGGGGARERRSVDWLTIHPRTRHTPSSVPADVEALRLLTDMFGDRVPVLVSGDVFALSELPYTSPLLSPLPTFTTTTTSTTTTEEEETPSSSLIPIPKLSGLMSARGLLSNPALFSGRAACPWEAVDVFMSAVARAPLPLKLAVHHLSEMCGPGFSAAQRAPGAALLTRRQRARLADLGNWLDVVDYMDAVRREATGGRDRGMVRYG